MLLHEREPRNLQWQTVFQPRAVLEHLVATEEEERNEDCTVVALLQPVGQSFQFGVHVATEHQVHVQNHKVRGLDVADAQIPQQVDGKHRRRQCVHQRSDTLRKMEGTETVQRLLLRFIRGGDDEDKATWPAREDLRKHK